MPGSDVDLLAVGRGTVAAPAGCGKTHLIAQAISRHTGRKPVLVLTHTNAGVAALRARLTALGVPPGRYRIATIDGWSMRLLMMFPQRAGHDPAILRLARPAVHYPAIRQAALGMLQAGHLSDVLTATYDRLIVDEYQDCGVAQHAIIRAVAACMPTCVLGDPLQAIFDFAGPLAHWNDHVCADFPLAGQLATPWRWINAGEEAFGRYLLAVRQDLLAGRAVDLGVAPPNLRWVRLDGRDDHRLRLQAGNVRPPGPDGKVLILADARNPAAQRDFAGQLAGAVTIETVDMRDLVVFGERLDLASPDVLRHVVEFAGEVMTNVGAAGMLDRVAVLQAGRQRREASDAEAAAVAFARNPSFAGAATLLAEIGRQGGVRAHRPAILRGALQLLRTCDGPHGITPAEAALRFREQSRLVGRPLARRTVGSTLLLKGLEADVAVLLDPSSMNRRHLYVAMTRGARQVIICSASRLLAAH